MAAMVWAVDAVGGAPAYAGRAIRQGTVSPFVGQATGIRPLGGLSGVRPGTPTNIATATSTTWTVTPFLGLLDGEAAAIAGVYSYAFSTNQTGSVTAAGVSARIDRLDVQVDDPAESDGSSVPAIRVLYTAGTAGAGVPAAAPSRSHPLALINVPATGGGSPTVTWNATYYCAPGGTVPFNTLAGLQAWTTAATSQLAFVQSDTTAQNNGTYIWDLANTVWRKTSMYAIASGVSTMAGVAGSSASPIFWDGGTTVTFPTGRFSVAPIVQAQMLNSVGGIQWVQVTTVTATNFTYRLVRVSGAPNSGSTVQWTAVQMTPTTADG